MTLNNLTREFRKRAAGITTAISTMIALPFGINAAHADEKHPNNEVVYAYEAMERANASYPNLNQNIIDQAHLLYGDLDKYLLTYDERQDSDIALNRTIAYLTDRYDLHDLYAYEQLISTIHNYSHIASGIYHAMEMDTGQGINLSDMRGSEAAPLQIQAVLYTQFQLALFVEAVHEKIESEGASPQDLAAFGMICQFTHIQSSDVHNVQNELASLNGFRVMQEHEFQGNRFNAEGQPNGVIDCTPNRR